MTESPLNYSALAFWLDLGSTLGTIVLFGVMIGVSRMKANKVAIADLRDEHETDLAKLEKSYGDRVARLERDVDRLHQRVDVLPDQEKFHELAMSLQGVQGDLAVVTTEVKAVHQALEPMAKQLDRVNSYLLEHSA